VSIAFAAEPSIAWDSIRLPPQSSTAIATVTFFCVAHSVQASTMRERLAADDLDGARRLHRRSVGDKRNGEHGGGEMKNGCAWGSSLSRNWPFDSSFGVGRGSELCWIGA
jgi:hypothetical protein